MQEGATSLVESGRAALRVHDWATAYRLLSEAWHTETKLLLTRTCHPAG